MNKKYKLILFVCILIIIYCLFKKYNNKEGFYNNKKKIAFCFLIYDKINQETLWYDWFKNVDKNKYNIYIHYKEINHYNILKI